MRLPARSGSLAGRRTLRVAKCAITSTNSPGRNNDTCVKNELRRGRVPAPAATPCLAPPARAGQYPGRVRLTTFWDRMRAQFGDVYAESVAKDYVFDELGGRTVERALADGEDAKVIWRAVCDTFNVPETLR